MLNLQPVSTCDRSYNMHVLYGIDMHWGEPCYVTEHTSDDGRGMLASFAADLPDIAETMAIESHLHNSTSPAAFTVRIREAR